MLKSNAYKKAVELGKAALENMNPRQIAEESQADFVPCSPDTAILRVGFLSSKIDIAWPGLDFSFAGSVDDVPLEVQVLLLHYLKRVSGTFITGNWISYHEIPDGKFYLNAFLRRAKEPMVQFFGDKPDLLVKTAEEMFDARPLDHGDLSMVMNVLPAVPVALILWNGDDEFPPDGNILFDSSISSIFTAEDIAVLAGMAVYKLIGTAKKL